MRRWLEAQGDPKPALDLQDPRVNQLGWGTAGQLRPTLTPKSSFLLGLQVSGVQEKGTLLHPEFLCVRRVAPGGPWVSLLLLLMPLASTPNFVSWRGQHTGLTLRDQHHGEALSLFPSVQCTHPVTKTFANPYEAKAK